MGIELAVESDHVHLRINDFGKSLSTLTPSKAYGYLAGQSQLPILLKLIFQLAHPIYNALWAYLGSRVADGDHQD